MAQCLFQSFPNNVTRVAISIYKNVDYDVKPAKMRFTSHENLLVHPLLLPVSSQREQTIVLHSSVKRYMTNGKIAMAAHSRDIYLFIVEDKIEL